jgi:hypothetical protein
MQTRHPRKGERISRIFACVPGYRSFYALFEQAGTNVEQATALLAKLISEWPDDGPRLRLELKELETDATGSRTTSSTT